MLANVNLYYQKKSHYKLIFLVGNNVSLLFSFPQAKQHIPHDPSEKPEEPTNVPESSFVKLAPSENRYTLVRHRDEL